MAANDRQQSTLKRLPIQLLPIQLLYPLEMHSDVSTASSPEDTLKLGSEQTDDVNTPALPKRAVARRAMKVTRGWIAELERDD